MDIVLVVPVREPLCVLISHLITVTHEIDCVQAPRPFITCHLPSGLQKHTQGQHEALFMFPAEPLTGALICTVELSVLHSYLLKNK